MVHFTILLARANGYLRRAAWYGPDLAVGREVEEGFALDGQKFDKLARAFATGTDRRTLLKIFVASAAAVAGTKFVAPAGVLAQDCPGDGSPGSCCFDDSECTQGFCVIQGSVGAAGICACTETGLGDPWLGCACLGGTASPCGDSGYECCGATVEDQNGVCGDVCIDPVCSDPDTSCEETGCCTEGECGANGWCTACYSGTEDPCGGINEAFGANYICCTAKGAALGAIGYCTEEALCISETPNTGSGTAADSSTWIAPAAAIGAAAAVMAYKSRETKADTEA